MDLLNPFRLDPTPIALDNGETIYLRRLSAADYVEWQEREAKRPFDASAHLLALAICDNEGNRRFRDSEIELIKQIDLVTINRLAPEIMKANGLTNSTAKESHTTETPAAPATPDDSTKKKPEPASDSTNS